MAYIEKTLQIAAPPGRVWQVMTDINNWPVWTGTTRAARRLEDGPLRIGASARMEVDRAPTAVWRVTEYEEGRSFVWQARLRGVLSVAGHRVEASDSGSKLTLTLSSSGLLLILIAPMVVRASEKNINLEADGLKAYCEGKG